MKEFEFDNQNERNTDEQNKQENAQQDEGGEEKKSYDKENPYFCGYANHQNEIDPRRDDRSGQENHWRKYPYGNERNPYENRPRSYDSRNQNEQPPRYQAPSPGSGQISYTPEEGNGKKSKAGRPVTHGTVAIACVITLFLSALTGFGGTLLANLIVGNGSSSYQPISPVVIYKGAEEVTDSTGAAATERMTYSQVAEMVKDSVVEIVTEFNNQSMWFQYVSQGAGSGVIISADGYVITNAHVITDEDGVTLADNIIVRLNSGVEYVAQTIAYDSDADIAILKIEAEGLIPAQCGNSDNLAVGEELVVVGNPLGELGGTVTNGIVSATEREIQMGGVTMKLIQTNAAVNPGNSGGGMFNMKGQLVGIVNAKSTGSGVEGLGFAIPINYALDVSEQLLQYGYVRGKTMIGVNFRDVSGSNYFYNYNIKAGVYVDALTPGYNDDVLQVGDRVIAVNGSEITSSQDIKAVVMACAVGDTMTFQLYRDEKLIEVEVTCYEKVPTQDSEIQFDSNKKSGFVDGEGNVQGFDDEDAFSFFLPDGLEDFFFGGGW